MGIFYRIKAIPARIAFIFDREYSHEWQIHLKHSLQMDEFFKECENSQTASQVGSVSNFLIVIGV